MKTIASCPPITLSASVGDDTPALRDARASREGALKHLLLLEEHLSQEQCPECCHKHLFTAIAYLEEARRLQGGDTDDSALAVALRSLRDQLPHVDVRPLRKDLQVKLGYATYGGPS